MTAHKDALTNLRAADEVGVSVPAQTTGDTQAALHFEGLSLVSADSPLPVIIGKFAQANRRSPVDFTATYTTGTTITLSNFNFDITDSSQILYIQQITTANTSHIYVNGQEGITLTYSANVITIHGAGVSPFNTGDVYGVGVYDQKKAYDSVIDMLKMVRGNPEWRRYTSAESYFTAVKADTTGAIIDVQGLNTLGCRYLSSDTAGMHGALLFYSSYDNGTSFERIRFSIPITRNRSGLFRLDCAAYTHVRIDYDEIAATDGELTLSIQKSNQPLSYPQEGRPPVVAHLRESAILTSGYVSSFLLDVDGFSKADIILKPNVAVDGGQIEMEIKGAYARSDTLVSLYSVVGVGTVIAGADTQSKLQTQRLIYEPISDTDEDPISRTFDVASITQLSVAFRDPSGVGTLTTLEAEVSLYYS